MRKSYRCHQCRYLWTANDYPHRCANKSCRSMRWDRPTEPKRGKGRPRKKTS
jgi:hypothetical protein